MTEPARRPTMRDVARLSGVSLSAVSLVARGERGVGEGTRQRVAEAMRRLGYAAPGGRGARFAPPNGRRSSVGHPRSGPRSGSAARGERGRALALVVERLPLPVLSDVAYAEVVSGMQAEARLQGRLLAFQEVATEADVEAVAGDAARLGGLLVLGSGDLSDARVGRLAVPTRAVVLVDNYVPGQALECVLPDHTGAGYLAAEHLAALGHRRIAFLAGPRKYKTLADRQDGYLRALAERGLPAEAALQPLPVSGTPRKGYLQMRELLALPHPPSAVVATSDKSALGALEAMREAGRRAPGDVALVGIDDIADAEHADPPLTTVSWPKRELGALAVRRLLQRIAQPQALPLKSLVPCRLVVRETCGARLDGAPPLDGLPPSN